MYLLFFTSLICITCLPLFLNGQSSLLIIGTYTGSNSEGIYVYEWNAKKGTATKRSNLFTSNPSFLAVHPSKQFVYAVNEDAPGMVSSFSINPETGRLIFLNSVSSKGIHPCYIAVHPSGKWVITGNYSSGGFTLYNINSNGSLSEPVQEIQHSGSSLNQSRQGSPHVHATIFSADGRTLFVPDLGIDQVLVYPFDLVEGKITETDKQTIQIQPGGGPRHLTMDQTGMYMYVLEELSGYVSIFQKKETSWVLLQRISSLPQEFSGTIGAADIHLSADGKFLYCSNRGDANLLTVFRVQQSTGAINPIQFISCGGTMPRNFGIDPSGKWLLAANQASNDVMIFKRNRKTGLLTATGNKLSVPMPVFTGWLQKR